ncbi:hypothetical protein ACLOJK_005593 [Asimina triloba]
MYGTPPEHGAPVWCSVVIFPNPATQDRRRMIQAPPICRPFFSDAGDIDPARDGQQPVPDPASCTIDQPHHLPSPPARNIASSILARRRDSDGQRPQIAHPPRLHQQQPRHLAMARARDLIPSTHHESIVDTPSSVSSATLPPPKQTHPDRSSVRKIQPPPVRLITHPPANDGEQCLFPSASSRRLHRYQRRQQPPPRSRPIPPTIRPP